MKSNQMFEDFDRIFVDFDGKCGTFFVQSKFLQNLQENVMIFTKLLQSITNTCTTVKNRVAKKY